MLKFSKNKNKIPKKKICEMKKENLFEIFQNIIQFFYIEIGIFKIN
jgi:hypothetical protein